MFLKNVFYVCVGFISSCKNVVEEEETFPNLQNRCTDIFLGLIFTNLQTSITQRREKDSATEGALHVLETL